jgi:hypothetical protein
MSSPEYKKQWAELNRERLTIYRAEYYQQNKAKSQAHGIKRREEQKEAVALYLKMYAEKNAEAIKSYKKEYYKANKNAISKKAVEYLHNNIDAKIASYLRRRLIKALKKNYKNGSAVSDLGCSIDFLKQYLTSLFVSGMSWDNYGQWHIDHIKPLSKFDLSDQEQIKKACHYLNLQPLWAVDNLKKGAKCPENS